MSPAPAVTGAKVQPFKTECLKPLSYFAFGRKRFKGNEHIPHHIALTAAGEMVYVPPKLLLF